MARARDSGPIPEPRFGACGLAGAFAILLVVGCQEDQDQTGAGVVNFYNWADFIADDTLPGFEAETGIAVRYDVFDSAETLEAKLLVGRSGYDVVVTGSSYFANQLKAGVFQALDESRLPNLSNLDPGVVAKTAGADSLNRYSVPYAWGVDGVAANVDQVRGRIPNAQFDSWDLLFRRENVALLEDCGVTLLDAPDDVVEVALVYLGYPGSEDLDHLRQAFDLLAGIRPYVRYFHSNQYVNDLANGEVCLSFAWPGDVYLALQRGAGRVRLEAYVPKEGSIMWVERLAIPADAPHPQNAHRLIDFLMRPEIAASFTNHTYYANGNRASYELVSPGIRDKETVYPSEEELSRLHLTPDRSPEYLRIRARLWTRLKSGT